MCPPHNPDSSSGDYRRRKLQGQLSKWRGCGRVPRRFAAVHFFAVPPLPPPRGHRRRRVSAARQKGLALIVAC